ncbi:hypothetical protein BS297_24680 [Rhodococcus erythropolis]|uniref:Uncharacterized protein n=1 Tax=Rhodococcus erythropolis TaxID=1833 RepID=A0A0C3A4A3_RHOER|nr:hypothetical protein BS297_24680 [Rhodococcus erythropolis]KIM14336.1 hypothetical protein QV65_32860 [Rhodococcus erythropolis]
MDVVVWAESEERERWWREIVGITTAGDRCVTTDGGEAPRLELTSTGSGSALSALRGMTAA